MADIQPIMYTYDQVAQMLSISNDMIRRLVNAGILVRYLRAKNSRISAESVNALVAHIKAGGDLWNAPKMKRERPLVVGPTATGRSGRKPKPDNGGPHSDSPKDSAPIKFVPLRRKMLNDD